MNRSRLSRVRAGVVMGALALGLAQPVPAAVQRLGRQVVPTFESVRLTLDAAQPDYSGAVHVDLEVKEPVASFKFHALDVAIQKLELKALVGSAGAAGPIIEASHATEPLGMVTVTTGTTLPPGRYALDISFTARFGVRQVGLYRMDQDGQSYSFSQFEPEDARRAFPCWDEPEFKIPYQITLVVPEAHTAITNTPVLSEKSAAGWRTIEFKKTPPLPSYLLAIATGPLESVEIPGMSIPGRVITVKGRKELAGLAVKVTPPLLAALEKYFGRPYPFEKLDLIAIPDYWPGAMENPGAITYSEPLLLVDQRVSGPSQFASLARVSAHELAHMWFGDLVTMTWWDDLWLNESFADWMGDKITDEVFPETQTALSELRGVQTTMTGDARPSTLAIRRPINPGDNILQNVGTAYNKGKVVLAMFERSSGAEKFRKGVLDYLAAHEWGNATASDLWDALSKSTGQAVGPAMETFIDQGGLPLVTLEPGEGGRVVLTQKRFANYGVELPAQVWQIPIALRFRSGGGTRIRTVLLTQSSQTVDLGTGSTSDWVMPDADATGYYRWKVPAAMMRRLGDDAVASLSAKERIGFLGNLSALLDAGAIHGDEYLEALGKFAHDPHPLVLSAVVASLGKVKIAFVPDESREMFAKYVRSTLGPALDRFGLSRKPGEDEGVAQFRSQLMGWLGEDGSDPAVREKARELARSYREDPASVDPTLAGVALRLAAQDGDKPLFDEYVHKLETAHAPQDRARYLSALGAFRDPAVATEALKYALNGKLRPQEIFQVTQALGDTSQGRDRLYSFITDNYATIVSRMPPQFASFMPFVASGCERERLDAATKFFSDPQHIVQGTSTTMARVTDQVMDCVGLRQREGAAVTAWLSSGRAAEKDGSR